MEDNEDAGSTKSEVKLGKLQFSLDYDFQKGEVSIHIYIYIIIFIIIRFRFLHRVIIKAEIIEIITLYMYIYLSQSFRLTNTLYIL